MTNHPPEEGATAAACVFCGAFLAVTVLFLMALWWLA